MSHYRQLILESEIRLLFLTLLHPYRQKHTRTSATNFGTYVRITVRQTDNDDFDLNYSFASYPRLSSLSPPVNIFTDRSRAVLLLGIIYVISILFLLCFRAGLFIDALLSPAGKG